MSNTDTPPRLDDDFSTQDIIAEARRPLLVERHRHAIEEMESMLGEALITGDADNPRLRQVLVELESESEQRRLRSTMESLASDHHFKDATLRNALIEHLCLLREEQGVEVARLQAHVIGLYRRVRELVGARQGEAPSLGDLRELPATVLGRLIDPVPPLFGSPNLNESVVYTPAFAERALRTVKRLRRADGADAQWAEADGDPPLPRDVELHLSSLSDSELRETRALLVRDRIRSLFYRAVFLQYLSADELDPKEVESHPTVLHWLQAVESTGHLYPFMQGQTHGQKAFRLGQLVQKIIQMHEMYARVAQAAAHPSYREAFNGLDVRARLALLARDHYPPLALTPELTLAALLCPFAAFVTWVQERVAAKDFVLPPDPRR
jgi:hypothetical protein